MNSSSQKRSKDVSESDGNAASRRRVEQHSHQRESSAVTLPEGVMAVGAMNNKSRIFVPGKNNTFAGISYDFVMFDNGCNSFVLPFPTDRAVLERFKATELFTWHISHSSGTGAIRSPMLTIKHRLNLSLGDMQLHLQNGTFPLYRLRFHVHKDAATFLLALEGTDLDETDRGRLEDFLGMLGDAESTPRRHVLLGQIFLKDKLCIQSDPVFVIAEKDFDGPIQAMLAHVQRLITPNVENFDEFHDLEDDDHGGDDNEEKRRSWGDDDYIDEPHF